MQADLDKYKKKEMYESNSFTSNSKNPGRISSQTIF